MIHFLRLILTQVLISLRSRAELQTENLFLRHQIEILKRSSPTRANLTKTDRLIFVWLSNCGSGTMIESTAVKPSRKSSPVGTLSFCLRMPAERLTFSWDSRLATVVMGMLSKLSFCSSRSMWISSSRPPEMEQAATPSMLSMACLTSRSAR